MSHCYHKLFFSLLQRQKKNIILILDNYWKRKYSIKEQYIFFKYLKITKILSNNVSVYYKIRTMHLFSILKDYQNKETLNNIMTVVIFPTNSIRYILTVMCIIQAYETLFWFCSFNKIKEDFNLFENLFIILYTNVSIRLF